MRDPNVEQYDVEEVLLQLTRAEQLHDRKPQPLLIDFGHAAGHAARHHSADIGMMSDVATEPDQLALRWKTGIAMLMSGRCVPPAT